MRRSAMAAVLVLAAGCANVHVNRTALAVSTVALACDWAQTRTAADEGWSRNRHEANPMLGLHPTAQAVDLYFVGAVVANAVLWLATPTRWRSVPSLAVVALQEQPIVGNIGTTRTVCGLR